MNQQVPKIAHISWKTKDILESQSPIILNGVANLVELNPDWNVIIYDDYDIDRYLKRNLSQSDYKLIEHKHTVEKSDVWRLLKMINEGGLYLDIDRFCNIPMSDIITPELKCLLPTCMDMDFSHDFMLTAPGNPIFDTAFKLTMQRRRQGSDNTYYLGPQTYMHAITLVLFDAFVDPNPGTQAMSTMRKQIDKLGFIKTKREVLPNESVIFKYNPDTFKRGNSSAQDWEYMKRELYAEFGLKHWTGEW